MTKDSLLCQNLMVHCLYTSFEEILLCTQQSNTILLAKVGLKGLINYVDKTETNHSQWNTKSNINLFSQFVLWINFHNVTPMMKIFSC